MLQRFGVTAGASGSASGDRPTGQVPGFSADLVERFGGPFHDVERVGAADRYRAAVLHHGGDPVRPVSGDMVISFDRSGPNRSKKPCRVALSFPAAAHTSRP